MKTYREFQRDRARRGSGVGAGRATFDMHDGQGFGQDDGFEHVFGVDHGWGEADGGDWLARGRASGRGQARKGEGQRDGDGSG